jgi:hypothetical protein
MKADFRLAYLVVAAAFSAVSACAGETPIDISSLVNEPRTFPGLNGITNGNTFPTGSQNFGGVPFAIPTGPNNYWNGGAAANFGPGVVSLTIPVGVQGVTSAFTLLNAMWCQPGPTSNLYITFTGSNGATVTQPLVGNVNLRDYNQDGGANSINNTSTIQAWTNGEGQRIDRQEYILPAAFATQVLTSVTITDTGHEDFSRAVFSGLTVSTCRAYVTETISTASTKIVYDPTHNIYVQEISLTNSGTTAVNGPLFFILEDLPTGVTLAEKSAATACLAPVGSRYVGALAEGATLAPNTTAILKLGFSDPSGAAITYTPLVAGSLGGAP